MREQDIIDLLAEANAYLKAERARVSLVRRGDTLYLQATLPPKPGSQKVKSHQQQISTGLPCSRKGVRKARAEAALLGEQLIAGKFDWDDYSRQVRLPSVSCQAWVERFEKNYRKNHTLKQSSWTNGWAKYFRKLPKDKPLSAEVLIDACLSIEDNTAARRLCCARMQALADFAGIEVDLLKYQGRYGRNSVKARELPSDELISEWCQADKIPNARWLRVLRLISAYGLRPHEAMLGGIRTDGRYQVEKGKTGPRLVRPFYPEWFEEWKLIEGDLPRVDVEKAYQKGILGKMISTQLKRYGLPFELYHLRHAWAVRVHVQFGLPESVGAKLMGHSEEEHSRTYQKWLDAARADDAIDRALAREDRPKPPS